MNDRLALGRRALALAERDIDDREVNEFLVDVCEFLLAMRAARREEMGRI